MRWLSCYEMSAYHVKLLLGEPEKKISAEEASQLLDSQLLGPCAKMNEHLEKLNIMKQLTDMAFVCPIWRSDFEGSKMLTPKLLSRYIICDLLLKSKRSDLIDKSFYPTRN